MAKEKTPRLRNRRAIDAANADAEAAATPPVEAVEAAAEPAETAPPVVEESAAEETPATEPAAEAATAANGAPFPWLKRNTAQKVLANAIAKLNDQAETFADLGIGGIPAALQILRKARDEMESLAKKGKAGPKNVTPGVTARVREKYAAEYEDVLTTEETQELLVKKVTGRHAHCELNGGKVAILLLAHLEVA